MWQDSGSRFGEDAFRYMPHYAVVIRCESACTLPTREKGGDESDPPKSGGACDPDSGTEWHTAIRPHGVALVLIYPCGKAWNSPPFPSRVFRIGPRRQGFASRPGRLRADPKDALLTRGKGGYRSASDFISHLIALDSIAPRSGSAPVATPPPSRSSAAIRTRCPSARRSCSSSRGLAMLSLPAFQGSRGLPLARVYVKHKHILLLIKVSCPVVAAARGNGDPASSASTLGGGYPGF